MSSHLKRDSLLDENMGREYEMPDSSSTRLARATSESGRYYKQSWNTYLQDDGSLAMFTLRLLKTAGTFLYNLAQPQQQLKPATVRWETIEGKIQ